MTEIHGKYHIMESTADGHEGEFAVMNTENGQVRRFPTVEQCRQFLGLEEAPGPKWIATSMDEDGNAIHEPVTVTADDEQAASAAGKSWFQFIGVFRTKGVHVVPK